MDNVRVLKYATRPWMLAVFTIQPLSLESGRRSCFSIWIRAYLQQRKTALVLMAKVLSQSDSEVRCRGRGVGCVDSTDIPALFITDGRV